MRTRISAGLVVILLAAGSPATAQTSARLSRFSFNLDIGRVGSTSQAMPTPAPATLVSVGTDVRLSEHWSLRLEAGRRRPSTTPERVSHSMYYFPNPEAPGDNRKVIGLPSTTRSTERSRGDVAILLRYGHLLAQRFEAALLGGLDLNFTSFRYHTTIPASLTPGDSQSFEGGSDRTLGVFDFGIEGGVRVTRRTTLLLYGIAGLQSPVEEHRNAQMRAGVIVRQRF